MLRLVKPSIKYKTSFVTASKEAHQEGRNKNLNINKLQKNFSDFVKKLRDQEKGLDLPKGYVPASTYWLIDKNKFIGRLSIRHRLNKNLSKIGGHIGYEIRPSQRKRGYGKEILRLGLLKAKILGIKKALITCNDDNIGSCKIIGANGGVLQEKIRHKGKKIRHYWIKI